MTAAEFLKQCALASDAAGINVARLARALKIPYSTALQHLFSTTELGMTAAHPIEGEDIPLYTLTHYGRYRAGLPVVPGARKPQEAK